MVLLETLILFAVLASLAYFRVSAKIWIPVLGVLLIVYSAYSHFHWVIIYLMWLTFVPLMLLFGIRRLRLRYLSPKVLAYFNQALPPMSDSEREALEAGDVHWEKELFCGQPKWNQLISMPKPALTLEEQAFLDQQVETLCAMVDDWKIVETDRDLPPEVWDYLKKEGFFGLEIPKEYGGHGFSVWAHSNIISKIASRSASVGVMVMVPNALGPAEFLQHYGTLAQKSYYLPRLARGEEIPAFALTGPEAGSDALSIPDKGIVCRGTYEGKEIIGIRLNWDKRYITLAPIATTLGIAFKMYDPEHLLGDQERIGITLCLLPTTLPGVEIGNRHLPSGLAFLNGPTRGRDVFIPLDFIIGGPEMRGRGWKIMMDALAAGRGVSLPALSTASAKLCYRMTGAYARIREQFRLPIGRFEGVAQCLGRIGGFTYLCEATRGFTLGAITEGVKPALGAAITKYQITEMGRVVCNDAMDIHAGRGIQLGPRNYLGFLYQSLPIAITVEGANILTRNLIIFGQGALRCHPYVRDEIAAAGLSDPKQRLAHFDTLFCKHLGYVVSNFGRALVYGLTGGLWVRAPKDALLNKYFQQLTRMSTALALTTDFAFAALGSQLKRKEAISARLGDILSQLYLASAVIKYYQDHNKPVDDRVFVIWTLDKCLSEIQRAFDEVLDNFTPYLLGRLLYRVIFPWGRAYRGPRDEVTHQIAAQMMKTSEQRDRLTQHCYVGKQADDPTGRMELALLALEKAEAVRSRWKTAVSGGQVPQEGSFSDQLKAAEQAGVISTEELESLQNFVNLRWDALQVDEFSPEFFRRGKK